MLQESTNTFDQRALVSWWNNTTDPASPKRLDAPPNDVRMIEATTKLANVAAAVTPNQVSKQVISYDQFNNQTAVEEFAFGNGAPGSRVRITRTIYETSPAYTDGVITAGRLTSPHIRRLPIQVSVRDGGDVERARTTYEYDNYSPALTNRLSISGHDSDFGASYLKRGNVTKATKWLLPSTQLSVTNEYDIAGNLVRTVDPRGNATSFDFSDNFGLPDTEARENTPPVGLAGLKSFAAVSKVTNALGHVAYTQYDYDSGKAVNGEDPNGLITLGEYENTANTLDRPLRVIVGVGISGQERQTHYIYNDALRTVSTESDLTTSGDKLLKRAMVYDGLGRTIETRADAPEGEIKITQTYDGMGRVKRATNPHILASDPTYGYTDTSYDELGRVVRVESFTGGNVSTGAVLTVYTNNQVEVKDQAGRKRRSITDALGRLVRVDEPNSAGSLGPVTAPVQATGYSYDTLDNLVGVTQGSQTRAFVYDSLSRLRQASNPEQINTSNQQVATFYEYDAASNLREKTDARGVKTTYTYDELNRVRTRTYTSDPSNTPSVEYSYDAETVTNSLGRLTSVSTAVSTMSFDEYDKFGQLIKSRQATIANGTQEYLMEYGYNLAGGLIRQKYPSNKVVVSEYDTAGRIAGVKKEGASSYYAGGTASDAMQYTAHGAVKAMRLGNGLWEHTLFNSRLQPVEIGLGTTSASSSTLKLEYSYGTSDNNGNVITQKITPGSTEAVITQSYGYDSLNRLQSAQESVSAVTRWTQNYGYDRFGNRTSLSNTGAEGGLLPTQSTPGVSTASNRLTGYSYDLAGNVTADGAGNTFSYDGENRQVRHIRTGVSDTSYSYDGDGRRVKKVDSAGTTVFVYDAMGKLVAEYTTASVQGSGTSYITQDHLGSTRVMTDAAGGVKARHDYLPYGEEINAGVGSRTAGQGYVADNVRQKFTAKERDVESGLDYFGLRYYSSNSGRFTSTDPLPVTKENFVNPQRWNIYIYVNNNPLAAIDPSGGDGEGKGGDKVISVFLAFPKNDRNEDSKKGPDWAATKRSAERNGYKLEIYGSPDVAGKDASAATGENFEKALKNSDVVIYVGHGIGSRDAVPFFPFFIEVGQTGYHPAGSGPVIPGEFGPKTLALTSGRPEASASVIGNFSCNSNVSYDFFENTAGLVQIQVTVDGGPDGLTAIGTLEKAANAFVKTYVTKGGSAEGAKAANKVINEPVKGNINNKDEVNVRLKIGNPPH